MAKNEAEPGCRHITRRIGSTVYKVKIVFPAKSSETMEEKILRMIKNEGGASRPEYSIMDPPQMGRQSERST